ncbi:MAG: diacylglycerol/polyprenol kinase family protein [Candidatus Methanofastidiosia archaeon]
MKDRNIKLEFKRKNVHYLGLVVPVLYYFVPKTFMLIFISLSLVSFLIIDYCRLYKNIRILNWFFGKKPYKKSLKIKSLNKKNDIEKEIIIPTIGEIMRKEEKKGFGAQTYFALGCLITILFYSKYIAISAIAILVVGDSAAALVGKSYGKHKIYRSKTLEGFLSCLIISFFICLILLPLSIAFVGSVVAAVTELFSRKLNDNLSIPIVAGLAMTIADIMLS